MRKIASEHGALLIFDEVITGFRLALGGATEYTGVAADLYTFGKIVGGGMPLAAYGGRRDIMSCIAPLGAVYQAGTLSGNPVAVAAGIETLKILMEDTGIYERIDKRAARLASAFREAGLTVNRAGSLLSAFFVPGWENGYSACIESASGGSDSASVQEDCASGGSDSAFVQEDCASGGKDFAPDGLERTRRIENYDDACQCDRDAFADYFNRMLARGIYVAPSQFEALFVSDAHSEELIDRTCEIISGSIEQMKIPHQK